MEIPIIILLATALFVFRLLSKHTRKPRAPKILPNEQNSPSKSGPWDLSPFEEKTAETVPPVTTVTGKARVVDGDTIVIRKTQIRLFGIDAPEINHPYGQKSKWAMVALCKGQEIRAEILETDTYGRTIARCHLPDGRDLSAELVKQGLAIDWPKFSGGKYRSLEVPEARKKMWLTDARQKGRMHVWEKFEAQQKARK